MKNFHVTGHPTEPNRLIKLSADGKFIAFGSWNGDLILKNNKLNPGRYYYKTWVLSSVFLIVFSSFMLSNFLENFGVLATSLIENPIRINFSHVLASAIVFAQLLTGAGYYIFYNNQKKSKEYIWPLLKVLMMFSLICIAFIEIIIWANLSASFDMTKVLGLGESDVISTGFSFSRCKSFFMRLSYSASEMMGSSWT